MALVIYRRREDADRAVSQFHKRTLDGAPMLVEIVEGAQAVGGVGGARGESFRGRGMGNGSSGSGGAAGAWRGEARKVLGGGGLENKLDVVLGGGWGGAQLFNMGYILTLRACP